MSARVVVDVDGGVADVRLARPEKMNAFDRQMFDDLVAAGESLKADRSVRAVVLSGEGRAFSAGLDLSIFGEMASGERGGSSIISREGRSGPANRGQQAVWVWRELEVPVIAAVHGHALGAGFQLALGADLRIVAPDAALSVLEVRWGLIPDMCGTWLLPRLIGPQAAAELFWTGRMVPGTEAVAMGLALRCADDPHAEALALARDIAARSPQSIAEGKRLLGLSTAPGRTVDEQLRDEERTMAALIGSPNQKEAVEAWFAKRPPAFTDR
ncbi:MAG TPA: crotonase/enoyl-CoA hydratase family protein [Acidimicrobiales bacterium]|nr:crotonase/enoyl-CoA hydratase family protein [Acidimicrobiales bacterium]